MRLLVLAFGSFLLTTSALARSTYNPGTDVHQQMEPLWMPLFSGGIVIGLAIYLLLRAIKPKR